MMINFKKLAAFGLELHGGLPLSAGVYREHFHYVEAVTNQQMTECQ